VRESDVVRDGTHDEPEDEAPVWCVLCKRDCAIQQIVIISGNHVCLNCASHWFGDGE